METATLKTNIREMFNETLFALIEQAYTEETDKEVNTDVKGVSIDETWAILLDERKKLGATFLHSDLVLERKCSVTILFRPAEYAKKYIAKKKNEYGAPATAIVKEINKYLKKYPTAVINESGNVCFVHTETDKEYAERIGEFLKSVAYYTKSSHIRYCERQIAENEKRIKNYMEQIEELKKESGN